MKDYTQIWKTKAHNKNLSAADMVAYCILKAIRARTEDKEELLKVFLDKAFSPHHYDGYASRARASNRVASNVRWGKTIIGHPIEDILDTEEIELFTDLNEKAYRYGR